MITPTLNFDNRNMVSDVDCGCSGILPGLWWYDVVLLCVSDKTKHAVARVGSHIHFPNRHKTQQTRSLKQFDLLVNSSLRHSVESYS